MSYRPGNFARRRAIGAIGGAVGAPPELTSAASLAAYGPKFAALGVGVAALEGVRELIKLQGEAETSARKLQLAEHDTGTAFQTASGYADTFTAKLGSQRDAARELAGALADLQLHSGNVFKGADLSDRLSTIVQARGLDAKEAAKLFQELGRGEGQAFEQLTGRSSELVLDKYARSIGTVTSHLTEMERSQALVNAALARSGEFADLAAERFNSSAARIERFKNSAHDLAQDYAASFLDTYTSWSGLLYGVSFGQFGEPEAVRQQRESEKRGAEAEKTRLAAAQSPKTAAQTAQQEQATLQQQQQSARALQAAFEKFSGESQVLLPDQQLDRIRELRGLLESLKGGLSTDDLDKYQKQFDSLTSNLVVQMRSARDAARSLLDDIGTRAHGEDNPFVRLFSQAGTSAERLRQQFSSLGDDVVRQLQKMERAAIEQEQFRARLQSNLKAVQLEFQADSLEKGIIGVSAEQARSLGIFQKRFEAAESAPAARREAEAYERGFYRQNAFQLRREEFADYENVKRLRPTGSDEAARTAQKLIDDYILEQTKHLPITARYSPDPLTRQLASDRSRALTAQAERAQSDIQDEIKRAEAGRAGVQLAGRELSELARLAPGGDRDTVRQEFLAIAKALDPKELTGALRQGTIAALREEAQHQRALEEDARRFQDELISPGGILYQIKEAIENQGKEPGTAKDAVTGEDEGKWQWTTKLKPGADPTKDDSWTWEVKRLDTSPLAAQAAARAAQDERQAATSVNDPHFQGDAASPLTARLARAAAPVQVNPYSQDFFRARPGYSPRNDPREVDADNPYQREFFHAGYGNNFISGSGQQDRIRERASMDSFLNVFSRIVSDKGIKIDGEPVQLDMRLRDDGTLEVLGKSPRADLGQPEGTRRPGDIF
jgi:hypothetical protein